MWLTRAARHDSLCGMKMRLPMLLTLLLLLAGCRAAPTADLSFAREVTDAFAGELQQALAGAMARGGPVAAVEVCRDQAPQIAASVSARYSASVGRVSDRLRNPANAATAWQLEGLALFAAEDASVPRLEYLTQADDERRYMRAIRIAPLCTACHGNAIAEPVAQVLARDYPNDAARGYQPGDLRGAFYVTWSAP